MVRSNLQNAIDLLNKVTAEKNKLQVELSIIRNKLNQSESEKDEAMKKLQELNCKLTSVKQPYVEPHSNNLQDTNTINDFAKPKLSHVKEIDEAICKKSFKEPLSDCPQEEVDDFRVVKEHGLIEYPNKKLTTLIDKMLDDKIHSIVQKLTSHSLPLFQSSAKDASTSISKPINGTRVKDLISKIEGKSRSPKESLLRLSLKQTSKLKSDFPGEFKVNEIKTTMNKQSLGRHVNTQRQKLKNEALFNSLVETKALQTVQSKPVFEQGCQAYKIPHEDKEDSS